MTKVYRVSKGQTLWSNKHEKYFYEGELIDLSHASPSDIGLLLGMGAIIEEEIKPVKKETQKEVTNG